MLAIALAACPAPAPAPAQPSQPADAAITSRPADAATPLPLDEDLPRLALRGVELYEAIVRVFASAGKDCAVATAQLRELQPTYAEVAVANAKVLHEGGAKALRAALEPHAARLDAAAKAIAGSMTLAECSGDRELTNAFDTLTAPP